MLRRCSKPPSLVTHLPPLPIAALFRAMGASCHRLANPLDCDLDLPEWWSDCPEDSQLWGAAPSPVMATPWTGLSYATPEHTDKAMEQAVRHALASALAGEAHGVPSCTFFALPVRRAGYYAHHTHQFWYPIGTLPQAHLQQAIPDPYCRGVHHCAATGEPAPPADRVPLRNCRHDLEIFAICNPLAFPLWLTPRTRASVATTWRTHYIGTHHRALPAQSGGAGAPVHPPRQLRSALVRSSHA